MYHDRINAQNVEKSGFQSLTVEHYNGACNGAFYIAFTEAKRNFSATCCIEWSKCYYKVATVRKDLFCQDVPRYHNGATREKQ